MPHPAGKRGLEEAKSTFPKSVVGLSKGNFTLCQGKRNGKSQHDVLTTAKPTSGLLGKTPRSGEEVQSRSEKHLPRPRRALFDPASRQGLQAVFVGAVSFPWARCL